MKFVFLHIEKSAGTSQRIFFKDLFGEKSVFWWDLDASATFYDEELVSKYVVVGGHKERSFYKGDDLIFSSIVRDPVERVVSLYNYFASIYPKEWGELGLDPQSLLNTLRNCDAFIDMIRDGQCRYISGENSFSRAKEVLAKEPFYIGSFEHLELYNKNFCSLIDYPEVELEKHNVGKANYKQSISVDENVLKILKPLLQEDQKLYDFINDTNNGLFNSVSNELWKKLNDELVKKVKSPIMMKASVLVSSIKLREVSSLSVNIIEHQSGYLTNSMFVGVQCFQNGKVIAEKRLPLNSLVKNNGQYKGFIQWVLEEAISVDKVSVGIIDPSIKQWLTSDVDFFEMSLS